MNINTCNQFINNQSEINNDIKYNHVHFLCPFNFCSCICSICNNCFNCQYLCHQIKNNSKQQINNIKNNSNKILTKTPLSNYSDRIYLKDKLKSKNDIYNIYRYEINDNRNPIEHNNINKKLFHDNLNKEHPNKNIRNCGHSGSVSNEYNKRNYCRTRTLSNMHIKIIENDKSNSVQNIQKNLNRSYINDIYENNNIYKIDYNSKGKKNSKTINNNNENFMYINKDSPINACKNTIDLKYNYLKNDKEKENDNIYFNNNFNKKNKNRSCLSSAEKTNKIFEKIISSKKRKDVYISLNPNKNITNKNTGYNSNKDKVKKYKNFKDNKNIFNICEINKEDNYKYLKKFQTVNTKRNNSYLTNYLKINSFYFSINANQKINNDELNFLKNELINKNKEIFEYKNKINSLLKELELYKNKKISSKLTNINNKTENTNYLIYHKKSKEEIKRNNNQNNNNNFLKDKHETKYISINNNKYEKENKINNNKYNNLKSKLNIKTDLNISKDDYYISESLEKYNISEKCIYTIISLTKTKSILCFDYTNKKFSFRDFADFGDFQENYLLSFENGNNNLKNNSIFLIINYNYYIVTGENCDMLYVFNSFKRTMNKLCSLKNNHSNGALINYSNDIICISGNYNKKVELYNHLKNEWINMPELQIERKDCSVCLIKNRYLFCLFGYNLPTKQYLNTIEYLDVKNYKKCSWKYLYYKNENLLSLYFTGAIGINYKDEKIIVIGGNNGKENIPNEYFYQLIISQNFNNDKESYIEKTKRKLKDIYKNKYYTFNKGYNIFESNNNLFYMAFDDNLRAHLFQVNNLVHDVFYLD